MRFHTGISRVDPEEAARWRKMLPRRAVAARDADALAATTAKGVDAATAMADEAFRLARSHTLH